MVSLLRLSLLAIKVEKQTNKQSRKPQYAAACELRQKSILKEDLLKVIEKSLCKFRD